MFILNLVFLGVVDDFVCYVDYYIDCECVEVFDFFVVECCGFLVFFVYEYEVFRVEGVIFGVLICD